MKTTISLIAACFVSCTPTEYKVDLTNYETQIKSGERKITLSAEDVIPVGSVQFNLGTKILTDYGELVVDKDGVGGSVVVDLSSSK